MKIEFKLLTLRKSFTIYNMTTVIKLVVVFSYLLNYEKKISIYILNFQTFK